MLLPAVLQNFKLRILDRNRYLFRPVSDVILESWKFWFLFANIVCILRNESNLALELVWSDVYF